VALSHLHWRRGEPDDQIAALERAISLDPSNAGAHGWLGTALSLAGRGDEAITHLEKAMRLDPRYPWKSLWLDSMAWGYFAAGRYEVAVDWAKRSVRVSPDDELGYRTLAASYAQLGRLEDASAAVAEELRVRPELTLEKVREENRNTAPNFLERWLDGLRKAGLPE
jgi:tetratricopeptide (TPR) repeat protein